MKVLTKRIMGMTLALMMLCSTCMTAFAATDDGSITITNDPDITGISISGQTFSAYKLFDVVYDAAGTSYAYTPAADFEAFLTSKDYTVSNIANFDSEAINAFTADVHGFIISDGISAADSVTVASGSEEATISDLDLGYYIVLGGGVDGEGNAVTSLCMLDTTVPDMTVTLKASAPTLKKEVLEETTYGKVADAQIGDSVSFKLTSFVPNTNGYTDYTYVMTDTLSSGLEFKDDVVVTIDGTEIGASFYTLEPSTNGFQLTIPQDTLDQYQTAEGDTPKEIAVTYSALLTHAALVYTQGNVNNATLEYSNNPYDSSKTNVIADDAEVYTYELNLFKYTENSSGAEIALAGAEFQLVDEDDVPYEFLADLSGNVYLYTIYDGITAAEGDLVLIDTIVSPESGTFLIQGLDAENTYYLKETKAPQGYNLLSDQIEIMVNRVISETEITNVTYTYKIGSETVPSNNITSALKIVNNAGALLPSTGGIGTTIFYVGGVALMVIAAGYFIIARKKKEQN